MSLNSLFVLKLPLNTNEPQVLYYLWDGNENVACFMQNHWNLNDKKVCQMKWRVGWKWSERDFAKMA